MNPSMYSPQYPPPSAAGKSFKITCPKAFKRVITHTALVEPFATTVKFFFNKNNYVFSYPDRLIGLKKVFGRKALK